MNKETSVVSQVSLYPFFLVGLFFPQWQYEIYQIQQIQPRLMNFVYRSYFRILILLYPNNPLISIPYFQSHIINLMSSDNHLPGSKPKKLWKKSNFNSPTFNSHSMASTLIMPQLYNYKRSRPKRQHFDSLDVAEKQFKKDRSESRQSSSHLNAGEKRKQTTEIEKQLMGLKKQMMSSPIMSKQQKVQFKDSRKLNYINSGSIKTKQMHAYNIINGL